MKASTATIITSLLSTKLHGMIEQLPAAASTSIDGLTAAIDETAAALTDFARSRQSPNVNETTIAFSALDTLVANEVHLHELNKFFENGTGKGSAPHKMVTRLLKIVDDTKTETLTDKV